MPHDQVTTFTTQKKKLVHNIYNYCECTPSAYLKRRHKGIFGNAMNYCICNSEKLVNHLQIFKLYHTLTLKETHISFRNAMSLSHLQIFKNL